MKLLLDTHVLLWFLEGNEKLSAKVRNIIEDLENERFVSIVSLWEIGIKMSLNKLDAKRPLSEFSEVLIKNDIKLINIEISHIKTLTGLPFYHKDPFDRMLISQAIFEQMTLLSVDEHFNNYPVSLLQ